MTQESLDQKPENTAEPVAADTRPAPEVMPSTEELLRKAELDAQEHLDAWLRPKAETENIRKRAVADVANAHKYAVENFAAELLAVKDSLEAALAVETATVETLKSGAELTLKQLVNSVEVIDVSDPAVPQRIGSYYLGSGGKLSFADERLCVIEDSQPALLLATTAPCAVEGGDSRCIQNEAQGLTQPGTGGGSRRNRDASGGGRNAPHLRRRRAASRGDRCRTASGRESLPALGRPRPRRTARAERRVPRASRSPTRAPPVGCTRSAPAIIGC